MNRQQAIEKAHNLRRGMSVFTVASERKAGIAPSMEVRNEAGEVVSPAIEFKAPEPRTYKRVDYKTIGEAKRAMRAIGCGVALVDGEALPQ